MNKREIEMTRRHIEALTSMRDQAWSRVIRANEGNTKQMINHDALGAAIKALEATLPPAGEASTVAAAATAP